MDKINRDKSGLKEGHSGLKIRVESLGLILRGLSLSEKRLLTARLSIGKGQAEEEPIYLKLFRVLSKGRKIEEIEELRNNPARLKHTKKYLAEKVLEVMGQNAELSPRVAIYQWLSQAEFLYLKGFHHESLARLHLALDLAEEYEFWEEQVSILEWIIKVKLHLGELDEALAIQVKFQETVELLNTLSRLRQIHMEVKILTLKEGLPRDEESRKRWESIMNDPLLIHRELPLRPDMERHIIKSQGLLNLAGPIEAAIELKELLTKLNGRKAVLISNPNAVLETWYLYLGLCVEARQNSEIKEGFDFLDETPFLSTTQNERKQLLATLLKARILIKDEQYSSAIELLEGITEPPIQEADHTEWMFFLAVAQVYSKKYSQALKSLNAISFDAGLFGVHPALQNYLRIIELIVHWGLGNYEFINHRAKALKYHLKKPGGQRRMEYLLVETLKKMAKVNKETERKSALLELKAEAERLSEEHFSERNFMYYFNLIRWIEVEIN